jgi:hypothetical protein
MKRNRTRSKHRLTLVQGGAGQEKSGDVYSPFGPVRAGLTTLQTTNDQPLTELLNELERTVAILTYKSSKVLDILEKDTARLALVLDTTTDTGGIDDSQAN